MTINWGPQCTSLKLQTLDPNKIFTSIKMSRDCILGIVPRTVDFIGTSHRWKWSKQTIKIKSRQYQAPVSKSVSQTHPMIKIKRIFPQKHGIAWTELSRILWFCDTISTIRCYSHRPIAIVTHQHIMNGPASNHREWNRLNLLNWRINQLE
jgi:hypothetical protein